MSPAGSNDMKGVASTWVNRSREVLATLYVCAVTLLALCVLGLLIHLWKVSWPSEPIDTFPLASFILLLLLAVLTELQAVRVAPGLEASAGFLAVFTTAAIAGPLASFVAGVLSQVVGARKRPLIQTLWYCASIGFVSGVAGLLYWLLVLSLGGFVAASSIWIALLGLGVGVVFQLLNVAVVAPLVCLRRRLSVVEALRQGVKPVLPFNLFFLIVTVGLISIYHLYLSQNPGINPAGLYPTLLVLLCLLPVVGLIYAFRAYGHQRELAVTNEQLARRNERLALQAIASQVTALDLKDNYTARHSAAVARWAADIAERMGLSRTERNLAHLAGLLHDVGKIGVPDDILKSSRRLDAESWSCIEGHCENGYRILRNVEVFGTLAKVVLCHHERYDGSGYPLGLRGEEIPLVSRIICVADSYSAMVSQRPYGPPLSIEEAMTELKSNKGCQFDPQVVDAFLALLEEHDERYRQGTDLDFELEMKRTRFLRELPLEPEGLEMDGGLGEDLSLDLLPPSELRSHAAADRRAAAARQVGRRSSA